MYMLIYIQLETEREGPLKNGVLQVGNLLFEILERLTCNSDNCKSH